MKLFLLDNKVHLKSKTFINYGKNLYNDKELKLKEEFDLPKYYLKIYIINMLKLYYQLHYLKFMNMLIHLIYYAL